MNTTKEVAERFPCPQCAQTFTQKCHIKVHIMRVHEKIRYLCERCKMDYADRRSLRMHVLRVHEGIKPPSQTAAKVHCEQCDKQFAGEKMLGLHRLRKHSNIPARFECDRCKSKFHLEKDLREHMRKQHERQRAYQCKRCDKTYKTAHDLRRHDESNHLNQLRYKCDYCEYATYWQNAMREHVQRMHIGLKPLQCSQCEERFFKRQQLVCHERNVHSMHLERKYQCGGCDRTFHTSSLMKRHIQSVHERQSLLKRTLSVQCTYCPTLSYNKRDHTVHNQWQHYKQLPIHCAICDTDFDTHALLLEHANVHKGAQRCTVCPTLHNNIDTHMRVDHGMPVYRCSKCPQWYTRPDKRTKHMRIAHIASALIIDCSICGAVVSSQRNLAMHITVRHPETKVAKIKLSDGITVYTPIPATLYKCAECDKEFRRVKDLQAHCEVKHATDLTFNCPHCAFSAKSRHVIRRHVKRWHVSIDLCDFTNAMIK